MSADTSGTSALLGEVSADTSFEMRRREVPDNPGAYGPPTWWVNDHQVSRELYEAVVAIVLSRREQQCVERGHHLTEPRCIWCGVRP